MELTPIYIVSQIFTILMYILLATTDYMEDRKKNRKYHFNFIDKQK